MASSFQFLLLCCSFFYLTHISQSQTTFSFPNPLLFPITKDATTLQYVTKILHGTPLEPLNLVLDLGGPLIWTDCSFRFVSSSSRPIPIRSINCLRAKPHDPVTNGCLPRTQTCELLTENGITRMAARGELVEDIVAVMSIDGSKVSGRQITTVDRQFLLSCVPNSLLHGLASGAKGMIGLGRTHISLPSQISTALDTRRKFSICLSSLDGIIVSDERSQDSIFGTEITRSVIYTPLVSNQVDTNSLQEYLIGVKSIKINGKRLSPGEGIGGTKLSTIVPYTTMESTVYATFIKGYIQAAKSMNMTRVASVAPFGLCFSSKGIDGRQQLRSKVPAIDLLLQSEMVKWRILGRNSMVQVNEEVMCLGFLDGGLNTKTSIVLGGHQLEDILVQFDLGNSMLGFSPSLLTWQTSCSDFKFELWTKESL